jgi:hypothetical protein
MLDEQFIDHEVRLRVNEECIKDLKQSCKDIRQDIKDVMQHVDNKLDSQFKWTIGIMITMFVGLILTKFV